MCTFKKMLYFSKHNFAITDNYQLKQIANEVNMADDVSKFIENKICKISLKKGKIT